MVTAVEFNHKCAFPAAKIHNETPYYELATKPEAAQSPLTNSVPKAPFGVGLLAAQPLSQMVN
jgi:hypothetical protein